MRLSARRRAAWLATRPTRRSTRSSAAGHPVIDIALAGGAWARRRVLPLGVRDRRSPAPCWASTLRRAQRHRVEGEHRARARGAPRDGHCPAGAAARARLLTLYGDAALRLTGRHWPAAGCARTSARPRSGLRRHPGVPAAPTASATPRCARHPGAAARPHAARRRPSATARASCTRPASSTRAARRRAASSSWSPRHADDLPIPGRKETFGDAHRCPGAGRLRQSLEAHGLPVLRVHLGDDPDAGLDAHRLAGGLHDRRRPRATRPKRLRKGDPTWTSPSSASAAWAPTWRAACTAPAIGSWPTTGRREKTREIMGEGLEGAFTPGGGRGRLCPRRASCG